MNILITSVGRRVQLMNCFKKEFNQLGGKVVAVDCDPTAPALYHANHFEIVPRIDHPEYISVIKDICKNYEIKAILSLIDPELTLLASHKEEFEKDGIRVLVSDKSVIDICYDKFATYEFLQENGLPFVPTYTDLKMVIEELNKGSLEFPLIVKPRNGSASIGVQKIMNLDDLQSFMIVHHDFIVQPLMNGNEYCVEVYIDLLNRQISNFFSKRKFNMRAGETDKSIVVKDSKLEHLIDNLIQALQPTGPVDVDFFETKDGYVISEINPRLGGGYPYAYEMGHNFINCIINNLQGITNLPYERHIGDYEEGKTMVRYDQFVVL